MQGWPAGSGAFSRGFRKRLALWLRLLCCWQLLWSAVRIYDDSAFAAPAMGLLCPMAATAAEPNVMLSCCSAWQ